jgi:histidyl-tRNA synthetase
VASSKTQPARGMRDFLPADVRRREYVIGIIKEVYERYGFEPLETPAVENIETLLGKYGEEGNQLIFKILKRGVHEGTGEADLALRYDLTVPLARVVAEYRDKLPKFFKRYQIQPVWRADRPARGRFREFYQCDVDILGSRSMVVEAEICAAVSDVLQRLGFDDYVILLNHREILRGILEASGVKKDKQTDALVALDKVEKIGKDGLRRELVERGVFSEGLVDGFLGSFGRLAEGHVGPAADNSAITKESREKELDEFNASWLEELSGFVGQNESGKQGIEAVKRILDLSKASPARGRIRFHPSLARGLSYYTGAIIEAGLDTGDFRGSIGGGGRYDNLVGIFLGQDVPACGFSLGLERIIVVMTEREMFPPQLVSSPADVMVSIWNEHSVGESLALASELRSVDLRVDVYPEVDKIGKQFKYASSRDIRFVLVLGDDERVRGEVSLKDMRSGEQRSIKREDLAATLRESL